MEKSDFKKYKNIVGVFFATVHAYNPKYTRAACEDDMKYRIFKYAKSKSEKRMPKQVVLTNTNNIPDQPIPPNVRPHQECKPTLPNDNIPTTLPNTGPTQLVNEYNHGTYQTPLPFNNGHFTHGPSLGPPLAPTPMPTHNYQPQPYHAQNLLNYGHHMNPGPRPYQ